LNENVFDSKVAFELPILNDKDGIAKGKLKAGAAYQYIHRDNIRYSYVLNTFKPVDQSMSDDHMDDYFSVDFISLGYMHPSYPIMFSAGFAYFNKAPHKFEFDTTNFAPSFSIGYLLSEKTFIAFVYTLPVMAIQNRVGSFLLAFGVKIF
jgi:hypothetical protein